MPIDALTWESMTEAVNEMKSPNQWLKNTLFADHDPQITETIEISVINKAREIAPFVRKNGEAVMVAGYTSTNQSVEAPNIRIKRPMTASELLFNRRPGSVVFPTQRQQLSFAEQHVARDLKVLADLVTNAEEYLCAMALQGTITYEQEDGEVFQITFPKPSGNNITLTTFWNDGTPTDVDLNGNLHAVKRVLNNEVGLAVTDAICGTEASDAFRALVAGGYVKTLDLRHVAGGNVDFTRQFNEDGVIYMGTVDGINFWEYGRTATLNGSTVNMIRPKYVEFVSRNAASQRMLYYGAIADMKAFQGRVYARERFSKSWEIEDPSSVQALLASRPLPVPRRPGSMVSMKVVSG